MSSQRVQIFPFIEGQPINVLEWNDKLWVTNAINPTMPITSNGEVLIDVEFGTHICSTEGNIVVFDEVDEYTPTSDNGIVFLEFLGTDTEEDFWGSVPVRPS